jgi:hypothetical protein
MQLYLIMNYILNIASNIDYMLQYLFFLFYDKNEVITKFIVDN